MPYGFAAQCRTPGPGRAIAGRALYARARLELRKRMVQVARPQRGACGIVEKNLRSLVQELLWEIGRQADHRPASMVDRRAHPRTLPCAGAARSLL